MPDMGSNGAPKQKRESDYATGADLAFSPAFEEYFAACTRRYA